MEVRLLLGLLVLGYLAVCGAGLLAASRARGLRLLLAITLGVLVELFGLAGLWLWMLRRYG